MSLMNAPILHYLHQACWLCAEITALLLEPCQPPALPPLVVVPDLPHLLALVWQPLAEDLVHRLRGILGMSVDHIDALFVP